MEIIIVVSLIFLVSILAVFVILKKLETERVKEVLNKFKEKKIIAISSNANFFGLQSLGLIQVRGNGVLILTNEELYYEMWATKKEISIPVFSIIKIETPMFHLAKTKAMPLLKITFQNKKGELDSIAWLVNNLEEWKNKIEELKGK